MRISDWSSDVCSSDLRYRHPLGPVLLRASLSWPVIGEYYDSRAPECRKAQQGIVRALAQQCVPQRPYPVCHAVRRRRRGQILGWQWNGRGQRRHGYLESWQSQLERSEEHTSELQSLMRISYAVFCLKKKNTTNT